jgi:hypothetical protein
VRLLASLLGREAPDFLGDGSFSLVAQLATRREGWTSDSFELVAGAMRARGQLSLTEAARPSLAGRVALETLPLPAPHQLVALGWPPFDFDIALRADRIEPPDLPHAEQASAQLRGDATALRLEQGQAQLSGGALLAAISLARGERAGLATEGSLADAVLSGPLTGRPLDLTAGRLSAAWRLAAQGNTAEALLASLEGTTRLARATPCCKDWTRPRQRRRATTAPRRRCGRPWAAVPRPSSAARSSSSCRTGRSGSRPGSWWRRAGWRCACPDSSTCRAT